jgi:hypothetical protein
MSRTTKEGKRAKHDRTTRASNADQFCAVMPRHTFGSSEKILRRNRKTWTRLGNKRRRRHDRKVITADAANA